MPAPEDSDLNQWAILWPPTGAYTAGGLPVYGSPEVIKCRWKFKRIQIISADGTPVALDATALVDQRIKLQSRMWLSSVDDEDEVLDEWYGLGPGSGSGGEGTEVMIVETYSETPDVKNQNRTRRVGLKRWRDQP